MPCSYCFGSGVNPHATDTPCYPCRGTGLAHPEDQPSDTVTYSSLHYERERLLIKQKEDILQLKEDVKKAEEKQKRAESKIKRMTEVLFSDKPIPYRIDRMKKILNDNEGMRIRHYSHPRRK